MTEEENVDQTEEPVQAEDQEAGSAPVQESDVSDAGGLVRGPLDQIAVVPLAELERNPSALFEFAEELLNPRSQPTARETWESHVMYLRGFFKMTRAARHVGMWFVGMVYNRLKDSPYVYSADGSITQSDLARTLGWSASKVNQAVKIQQNFSLEEIRQYCTLPLEVLVKGALLPGPDRASTLPEFVDRYESREIRGAEMVKKISALLPPPAVTAGDPASGTPSTPAMGVVRAQSETLITLLADLKAGINSGNGPCPADDREALRDLLDRVRQEVDEVSGAIAADDSDEPEIEEGSQ